MGWSGKVDGRETPKWGRKEGARDGGRKEGGREGGKQGECEEGEKKPDSDGVSCPSPDSDHGFKTSETRKWGRREGGRDEGGRE